jgi:hypothetical protein
LGRATELSDNALHLTVALAFARPPAGECERYTDVPMGALTLGYLRVRLSLATAQVVPDAQNSRCRQI